MSKPENVFTEAVPEEEIGFKEILGKVLEWWELLWSQKKMIISISLVVGLAAALHAKFIAKRVYQASYSLFFEEEGAGLSGAMRLASSFGLAMGGASGSSNVTVQEYLTSRDNISKALSTSMGEMTLLEFYYQDELESNVDFKESYTRLWGNNQRYSDSLITETFISLNENNLSAAVDEESGMLSFSVKSKSEQFAFRLAKELVLNTEKQFKTWKVKKGQDAVGAFQSKVDSLELTIDQTLQKLGEYEDQNNSLVSSVDKMKRMRLTIDMEALKVAYGEYIKGLEMSKADLLNVEAPFKYFDEPTYPLQYDKPSAAINGVVGSIVTGFLLVFYFIGRHELELILEK